MPIELFTLLHDDQDCLQHLQSQLRLTEAWQQYARSSIQPNLSATFHQTVDIMVKPGAGSLPKLTHGTAHRCS